MIDSHAALGHDLFEITIRDAEPNVEVNRVQDHRLWVMRALETDRQSCPAIASIQAVPLDRSASNGNKHNKVCNRTIESDHAALKRLLGYRQSFKSLRCAKATLQGMETIRTIKTGHIKNRQSGVRGEVAFVSQLFGLAA
ncbi:MAG: DDE-type integrase/transposase/recombinase [Litoreibacter sp.]